MGLKLAIIGLLVLLQAVGAVAADRDDPFEFNDFPLKEAARYPAWFKKSFLDLRDDLKEAVAAGKQGIVLYFGQANCAYCRMLLEVNFGLADVAAYTQRHYDLIPIDILGGAEVTDLQGEVHSERQFAYRLKTTFTPTLVFFNGQGQEIFRLQGYYPPYQFRAGLEYAVDGHYQRESFADYLARGEDNPKFDPKELTEEPFFIPPPHNLDRTRIPGERPLAVFFERGECHACDVLHGGPLRDPDIARAVRRLDVVQLDMQGEQPLITPAGRVSSPRDWARALGLFYAPSLLFFDEQGREVLRVDSVVGFYRLQNVLSYINSGAYRSEPSYLRWRASQGH